MKGNRQGFQKPAWAVHVQSIRVSQRRRECGAKERYVPGFLKEKKQKTLRDFPRRYFMRAFDYLFLLGVLFLPSLIYDLLFGHEAFRNLLRDKIRLIELCVISFVLVGIVRLVLAFRFSWNSAACFSQLSYDQPAASGREILIVGTNRAGEECIPPPPVGISRRKAGSAVKRGLEEAS